VVNNQNMKPYPAYKPSGVPWLGDIPAHWDVRRLRLMANILDIKLLEKPLESIYLGLENIESKTGKLLIDVPVEHVESSVNVFRPGNILFGKLRPYLAKVAHPDFDGVCTTEILVIDPKSGLINRFLFYIVLSDGFIKSVDAMTYGTRMPRANKDQIGNMVITLPPLAEQQAIAAYLDGETARLDALADRYRRLLALLDEKRRALITHAVTRGLNPTAPLKDSGIEWLGRIPEAWKIAKIKHIVDNTNGSIRPGPFGSQLLSSEMESGDIKVYNQRSVINHDVSVGENFITEQKFRELRTFEVSVGDILITSRGTIGKCLIVPENAQRGIIHPCLIRIRLDISKILREYFSYVFQESSVIQDQLFYQSNATTIEVIYSDNIKRAVLALPPITEQRNIVEYLDRETARLDDLKAKIETLLARLGEYRAALISAAVTGKMDVHRPAG